MRGGELFGQTANSSSENKIEAGVSKTVPSFACSIVSGQTHLIGLT